MGVWGKPGGETTISGPPPFSLCGLPLPHRSRGAGAEPPMRERSDGRPAIFPRRGAEASCGPMVRRVRGEPPAPRAKRRGSSRLRRRSWAAFLGRSPGASARGWRRVHRGTEGARVGPWRSAVLRRRRFVGLLAAKTAPRIAVESSAAGGLCLGSGEHGGRSAGQIGAEKVVTIW